MSWILAQDQTGQFLDIIKSVNSDILGAVMILGTIGFFLTAIITVVTISQSITNIRMVKIHHSLINDLLKQGYSAEDVERLMMRPGFGGQFKKLVRAATNRLRNATPARDNRPVPPVKQTA